MLMYIYYDIFALHIALVTSENHKKYHNAIVMSLAYFNHEEHEKITR